MPAVRACSPLLSCLLAVPVRPQIAPDAALAALRAGNARFVQEHSLPHTANQAARQVLAEGQHPGALVLCCADSRVPPEHVFDAGVGELFVIRVAGNVCDAEVLASVEYAAEHLGVTLGVVLGHEGCGAVQASAQHDPAAPNQPSAAIAALLARIEPAVQRARALRPGTDIATAAEEENVQQTVHECLRRSKVLRERVAGGKFKLVPARYRLATGAVEWLPERPFRLPAPEPAPATPHRANVPPHAALARLHDGHRRFLSAASPLCDVSAKRREALTKGQRPFAVVVTCADSRVAPEHLFDCGLGEIFVVRVAGNIVNDDVQASIEYAVEHTGASAVVFVGHSHCGAVKAACASDNGHALGPNLEQLIARIAPAVEHARREHHGGDALLARAVQVNVLRARATLQSKSAAVRHLEQAGQLAVLCAVYQLDTGALQWLHEEAAPTTPPAAPPKDH
jgi:carbonic anhydrase